jgi:hypothetical protein
VAFGASGKIATSQEDTPEKKDPVFICIAISYNVSFKAEDDLGKLTNLHPQKGNSAYAILYYQRHFTRRRLFSRWRFNPIPS